MLRKPDETKAALPADSSSTQDEQKDFFVVNADMRSRNIEKFNLALGDKNEDGQPGQLSRVFDYAELPGSVKEQLKQFCDPYRDAEAAFLHPHHEMWANHFNGVGKNKSVFNDESEFQMWVLELMPYFEADTNGSQNVKTLSEKIRNLIFAQAYKLLHDKNGNIHEWAKNYFGNKRKSKQCRVDAAIEKFGQNYVSKCFTTGLVSLFAGELCKLIIDEKNFRFVSTVVKLLQHQLNVNSIFLHEGQAVAKNRLFQELAAKSVEWSEFLDLVKDAINRLPSGDCGKFIPLLRLSNSVTKFPEDSTAHKFLVHELLYQVRKFKNSNKFALAAPVSDLHYNAVNQEVDDFFEKLIMPNDEAKRDGLSLLNKNSNLDVDFMFNYHFAEINKSLDKVEHKDFSESGRIFYNRLIKESNVIIKSLLDFDDNFEDSQQKIKIEAHLKKLESARFIIDFDDDQTLEIRAEILRFYLPSPEVFPAHIRQYFKDAIESLKQYQYVERAQNLLLPTLKFANVIAEACEEGRLTNVNSEEAWFDLIHKDLNKFKNRLVEENSLGMSLSLDIMSNEQMKNYFNVFNKIYAKKTAVVMDDKSVGIDESKGGDAVESVEALNTDVFSQYTKIQKIVEETVASGEGAVITKRNYLDVLNHVTKEVMASGATTEAKFQLERIVWVMHYLKPGNIKAHYRPKIKAFDVITAPYLNVRSILILECLKKLIFHSKLGEQFKDDIKHFMASKQDVDVERATVLYSTFINLEKLSRKTDGKDDALSRVGSRVLSDACLQFKNQLQEKPTDLTPVVLNNVLIDVNEVIAYKLNKKPFPLSNLNNLQEAIPRKINNKGRFWGGIICLIGLATIAAGYYFSPVTLGVSAIVGAQVGQAIIMSAGVLTAAVGAYVISSNSSSGLAKSLGRFLSTARKVQSSKKNDELLEPFSSALQDHKYASDDEEMPFPQGDTLRLRRKRES